MPKLTPAQMETLYDLAGHVGEFKRGYGKSAAALARRGLATSVENQVIHAIGRYFLTEPKPSEYRGRRGTWEGAPALEQL